MARQLPKIRNAGPVLLRLTSGLAHELRNPLNSAILQLDTIFRLQPDATLPEPLTERLAAIESELRRMAMLVDDYLSLTEPREILPRPVALVDVVESAITNIAPWAAAGNVIVGHGVTPSLPLVSADFGRLTQVVTHILRNALEAVEPISPRTVYVDAGTVSSFAEVRVHDTGVGIPEHIREHMFKPFFSTKEAGTGLGLTLVQQLVSAHGGRVMVRSRPGETVVGFTVPLV